jgi:hypothetical protein
LQHKNFQKIFKSRNFQIEAMQLFIVSFILVYFKWIASWIVFAFHSLFRISLM